MTVSPPGNPLFRKIEARIAFTLRFRSGLLANCAGSYDAFDTRDFRVRLDRGWIALYESACSGLPISL